MEIAFQCLVLYMLLILNKIAVPKTDYECYCKKKKSIFSSTFILLVNGKVEFRGVCKLSAVNRA